MKKWTRDRLIEALEFPAADGRPLMRRIRRNASSVEVVKALAKAKRPLTRQLLCDVAGYRKDRAAVPVLCQTLKDRSPKVRGSAAEALAKIGDPRAANALRKAYKRETEKGAKEMMIVALGAIHDQPSKRSLIHLLSHGGEAFRGVTAWSLQALGAREAIPVLKRLLPITKQAYAYHRIASALEALEKSEGI